MTDNPHNVSRRDFLKLSGVAIASLAFRPELDPKDSVPKSNIFKDEAFSTENLGFELLPTYKDHNTLKYNPAITYPPRLDAVVKDVNLDHIGVPHDSQVTQINWIIDPITKKETSICTLYDGTVVAFFGSKDWPIETRVFDVSVDSILDTDVLHDHCIKIRSLNEKATGFDESTISKYIIWHKYRGYKYISPQLPEFYEQYQGNISDHQDISTSDYRNEQFVKSSNQRIYGLSTVGSYGDFRTSLLAWSNRKFTRVAQFPENETAEHFDGNRFVPSVLCLDHGQLGFISKDRSFSNFETNKFKLSFKIADASGVISKLDIKNPEQKYNLISNAFADIEAETDINKIHSLLANSGEFKGNPDDILAIFKINKNGFVIPEDVPWILVSYPNAVGEYDLQELEIPEKVTDQFKKKYSPKRFDYISNT